MPKAQKGQSLALPPVAFGEDDVNEEDSSYPSPGDRMHGDRFRPEPQRESVEYAKNTEMLWETMAEQQRELHDEEVRIVCAKLRLAVALRDMYRQPVDSDEWQEPQTVDGSMEPSDGSPNYDPFTPPTIPPGKRYIFEMRQGVTFVWKAPGSDTTQAAPVASAGSHTRAAPSSPAPPPPLSVDECAFDPPPSYAKYTRDLARLMRICADPAVNSFSWRRLNRLESRFQLHVMEHEQAETTEQRKVPHRDFYNIRKVDTHIHLAAAMNQKHLLRFIKKKCRTEPHTIVSRLPAQDGTGVVELTLAQALEEMGTSVHNLNLDALGMHADTSTFCRFDKFNLKYNPLGDASLRNIFLKTDNELDGRYFAELTKELFDDLHESKYQNTEYRISIYGRTADEWDKLAAWIVDNRLYSPNNRWVIQIPRLYGMYASKRMLSTFGDFLANIFLPLFQATDDPDSHPALHLMLQQTVAIDSVDDESKAETPLPSAGAPTPEPDDWTTGNPHYSYYSYYIYANLYTLNQMRRSKGLSTFDFRPHAGEAGELNHLHTAFLTAHGINHGINLRKLPSLNYLYYLCQVGLAFSPLSNNALFLRLSKNPFYEFFSRGLNITLSTDDPLMFHHTKEPLMEEYCVAKQVWRLSSVDLAEIARNSVLQSSFEPCVKAAWLGRDYRLPGVLGNDITRTNLPNLRLQLRHALLTEERLLLVTCVVVPCAISTLPPDALNPIRVTTADITAAHEEFGSPDSPTGSHSPFTRRQPARTGSRFTLVGRPVSTDKPKPNTLYSVPVAAHSSALPRGGRAVQQRKHAIPPRARPRGGRLRSILLRMPTHVPAAAAAVAMAVGVAVGFALARRSVASVR